MPILVAPALFASLLLLQAPSQTPRQFGSGYAGTLPGRDADRARTFFNRPEVRALLALMEGGSVARDAVEQALKGSPTTIADLLHVGLIRADGDRYAIGFAYFTAGDMKLIHAVADRVAPDLAAAYRARQEDLDRIFSKYPVPSVPRGRIAFVLLTGFCLNWDGLAVTRELGLRRPIWVEGPGYRYSFWASETADPRDYREVYWGSSTFPIPPAEYSFSSFGDPDSDPRMNAPDLLFLPLQEMAPAVRAAVERVGVHDEDVLGRHFDRVLGTATGKRVSDVLFALRRAPRTADQLQEVAGPDARPLLALLEEIQYVSTDAGGVYHLTVPVFDTDDGGLVTETIELSRAVMRAWLRANLPQIRRELSTLTALRNGLSFEALFTQIWHEIFGLASRELARTGVTTSAYGQDVRYKASLSVLWRTSLYSFSPDR